MPLLHDIPQSTWDALKQLYAEAFPPEERRPVSHMIPKDPAFRFYAIDDSGLLTAWHFPEFTFIEHFAIFPEKRGFGIGSQTLAELSGNLILEVEPPTTGSAAKRRIAFYERNKFRMLDIVYMQPPYSSELPSVELRLMIRGEIANINDAIRIIHSRVYGTQSQSTFIVRANKHRHN